MKILTVCPTLSQFAFFRLLFLGSRRFSILTALIILYSVSVIAAPQKNSTLTDPTRPPYYQGSTTRIISKEDLKLTAIITSQDRRLAVVNDEIVKTGDKIGDITVVDIGKSFVKFHSASGYFNISLHSDID